MPDPGALITAALTSIAGTLATIAKERADKAAIRKELKSVGAQIADLVETVDRMKARMKQARGSIPDSGLADVHRQLDELHEKVDVLARRIDEHDGQWMAVGRELGAIGAKIEILLSGSR